MTRPNGLRHQDSHGTRPRFPQPERPRPMTLTEAAAAMREAAAKIVARALSDDGQPVFAQILAQDIMAIPLPASPPDPRRSVEEILKEIKRLQPKENQRRDELLSFGAMVKIAALEWVLSRTEKDND